MSIQTRRHFLATLSSAGAAGLISPLQSFAQEGPPQTTTIRLAKIEGEAAMRAYESTSEVLAFAPSQKRSHESHVVDEVAHRVVALLREAADVSAENVERVHDHGAQDLDGAASRRGSNNPA